LIIISIWPQLAVSTTTRRYSYFHKKGISGLFFAQQAYSTTPAPAFFYASCLERKPANQLSHLFLSLSMANRTPPNTREPNEPPTTVRRSVPYPTIQMEHVGQPLFDNTSDSTSNPINTPKISSEGSRFDPEASTFLHPRGRSYSPQNESSKKMGRRPVSRDFSPSDYADLGNNSYTQEDQQDEFSDTNPSRVPMPETANVDLGLLAQMAQQIHQLQKQLASQQNQRANPYRSPNPSLNPHSTAYPNDLYEDEIIQKQADRYEKRSIQTLSYQTKVLLRPGLYMNWRQGFLLAAEAIEARDLIENQENQPPHWLTKLESAIWRVKHRVLLHYLISTLTPTIAQNLEGINRQSLLAVWRHLQSTYGISRAQERLNVVKSFKTLSVEGNNYHNYLSKYRKIVTQMENLGVTIEDILHDNFIAGLGDYNKVFVDSQLDIFYAKSRNNPATITNLNLSHLQEALLNRATECEKIKRKDDPRANEASASQSSTRGSRGRFRGGRNRGGAKQGGAKQCPYCYSHRHTDENACAFKHPELGTEDFRKKYDSMIKYLKEKHASGGTSNLGNTDFEKQVLFNQPSANSAVALSSVKNAETRNWYLDTCASFHMCPSRSAFVTYQPYTGTKIKVANDTYAEPVGIGKVVIEIDDGVLELDEVRHVPALGSNLVSYGQLDDQGFGLSVSETSPRYHTIVTLQGDIFNAYKADDSNVYRIGECAQIGNRQESTAYLATEAPDISAPASIKQFKGLHSHTSPTLTSTPKTKSQTMTLMEWHQRLAHLNAADILKLARDPNSGIVIKGSKILGFCDICHKAKQTRKVSRTSMPRATKPLARIHIDIAGGGNTFGMKDMEKEDPVTSRQGAHYYMLLTDDATRYRWVFFLNKKSDALIVLKWWVKWMKNQGFQVPAFFHMDNELVTNEMKEFCLAEGIKLEPSNPDSPWQDGVSERGIRTLSGLSRAAMLDSNLPIKFWADCVESTSLVMNEVPTSTPLFNSNVPGVSNLVSKQSPYNIPSAAWFGTPPELLHFRKWGSPVTYHLHGSTKPNTKFDARARNGYFIGYNGKHIYRIWDPETDTIVTTSDVDFHENFHDGSAPSTQIQGGTPSNNGIAQTGRASHLVNPSSTPVAAATTTANTLPELRFKSFQESDVELDPDYMWYRPAKNFKTCI
jgi:hypothetical protein